MTIILFRRIRKDTWKLIIPKELKKLIIMPPKQSVVGWNIPHSEEFYVFSRFFLLTKQVTFGI